MYKDTMLNICVVANCLSTPYYVKKKRKNLKRAAFYDLNSLTGNLFICHSVLQMSQSIIEKFCAINARLAFSCRLDIFVSFVLRQDQSTRITTTRRWWLDIFQQLNTKQIHFWAYRFGEAEISIWKMSLPHFINIQLFVIPNKHVTSLLSNQMMLQNNDFNTRVIHGDYGFMPCGVRKRLINSRRFNKHTETLLCDRYSFLSLQQNLRILKDVNPTIQNSQMRNISMFMEYRHFSLYWIFWWPVLCKYVATSPLLKGTVETYGLKAKDYKPLIVDPID